MYPMRDLLLEQESEDFRALPDLTQAILSRQYLFFCFKDSGSSTSEQASSLQIASLRI